MVYLGSKGQWWLLGLKLQFKCTRLIPWPKGMFLRGYRCNVYLTHPSLTLGHTCPLSSPAPRSNPSYKSSVSLPAYLGHRYKHLFKDGIGLSLIRTTVLDANMECTGFGNKPVVEKAQEPI